MLANFPQMFNYFLTSSDGSNNVRSSMFVRSKAKNGCSSSIANRWTCSVFVQCSKKWCSSVRSQKLVFEFDCQDMNTFSVRSMFEILFDEHLVNIMLSWNMLFLVGIQSFFAILKNLGNVFHENYYAKSSVWYLIRITVSDLIDYI